MESASKGNVTLGFAAWGVFLVAVFVAWVLTTPFRRPASSTL